MREIRTGKRVSGRRPENAGDTRSMRVTWQGWVMGSTTFLLKGNLGRLQFKFDPYRWENNELPGLWLCS